MIASLFTETGIMPLKRARHLLVLSHLQRFLGLKDNHTHAVLKSSIELADMGKNILSFRSREGYNKATIPLPRVRSDAPNH
jgi:hypothetical protein